MEHRFNLIDEPWIPVADKGRVGLKDIFTHPEYRTLGGNPVQKAAILKLLQAITQAAATPQDMEAWQQLGWQGMADRACSYLAQWHDRFYLYGPEPFLQMPAIAKAAIKSFGTVLPDVATGNTTVLTQTQAEQPLDDGERALLLITQMGFALGGKKVDNSVTLSPGYQGKTKSGKPGPAVAHMGLLHNYFLGPTLLESIWLNLFTEAEIADLTLYPLGLGTPPWEQMPEGEDCNIAQQLKGSLMGRLLPLCRFCLLTNEGLHYSEGIAHGNYKDGVFDPSVAIDISGKEPKVRWADPERRPWRELTSLLSFIRPGGKSFDCHQLRLAFAKVRRQQAPFAVWSGGLKVRNDSGEQSPKGSDDMVESLCWFSPNNVNELWFSHFQTEIGKLDELADTLDDSVINYYKTKSAANKKPTSLEKALAKQANNLFWQLCERQSQALIDGCDEVTARQQLRRQFARYTTQVFDQFCPHQTARQIDAWAKTKPNLSAYLQQEQP